MGGISHTLHKLLQSRSLPCGAVLWEQTAPVKTLLSVGPHVLSGACSSTGFPQGHNSCGQPPALVLGSSTGCRWAAGKHTPLPQSSPQAAGESLLWHLGHLLSLLWHWPWCLQNYFSQIFTILFVLLCRFSSQVCCSRVMPAVADRLSLG